MTATVETPTMSPDWALSVRNRRWARPLEGRVVWSHCTWIGAPGEPLTQQVRRAADGAFTCCSGVQLEPAVDLGDDIGSFLVHHEASTDEDRALVAAAVGLLTRTRHTAVPVLAGGVVVTGTAHGAHPVVTLDGDADEVAARMLATTGRMVLASWYEVIGGMRAEGRTEQPLRDFDTVATLFADCLAFEHHQRRLETGVDGPLAAELTRRRDAIGERLHDTTPESVFVDSATESVVAELVSYHYPHWNRSHFPFHSPWDTFRVRQTSGGVE
jgi:hypothetical protein